MFENLVDRFITYAKKDTRSDITSSTIPTTQNQVDFAHDLVAELTEIGFSDVEYNTENGFVTATLEANTDQDIATVGFISHMDTADFNSVDIQPQIHENYDGGIVELDAEAKITLDPNIFPNLKNYLGKTLITTNGHTLLGADDKAGITEIITACEYLLNQDEIKHGRVRMAFGPDEEIGMGADHFDVEHFDANFAYTVDGGPIGELQYESFNAAAAKVTVQGQNVHPGTAKNQMVNAMTLAMEFESLLPANEVPEHTEGREGFFHLTSFEGTVEETILDYIIRDHDRDAFEARKITFEKNVAFLNEKYGTKRFNVEMYDQYYNMAEVIEEDMTPVDIAKEAMERLDIVPIIEPIRGGTDGSKISFMGLPTPNIFSGGENYHGRYEFIAVESMEIATKTIIEIIKGYSSR